MGDPVMSAVSGPLLPAGYALAWAGIALVVVLTAVVAVVLLVRAARARSGRAEPERLAELDALLAAGAVTPEEHAAARAAVLRR